MSTINNEADTHLARSHLATFFRSANECMECGHWFAVRGNCRESLVRFTSVLINDYAAILYVAKFVSVNKKGGVTVLRDEWDKFLTGFQLDENGSQSIAEANISKIDCRKLMEESYRPAEKFRKEIFFVRVGAYPPGESGNASDQIEADIPPPNTSLRFRSVQRRFTLAMSDLFEQYRDLPAVAAVAAWVEWKEVADYGASAKGQDSSDSEEESDDVDSEEEKEEHDEAAEEEKLLLRAVNYVNKEMTVNTDFTYSTSSRPRLEASTNSTSICSHYPPKHEYATKYPLLNEHHRNLMDRSDGTNGMLSRSAMDNLLREIVQFKTDHKEPLTYESTNSKKTTRLMEVPLVNESDFYKKAKSSKWLDEMYLGCTTSNSASSGVKCILEYTLKRYRTEFESVLCDNGLLPKIMNEYQVMALMKLCGFGIAKFRLLKQALQTYLGLDRVSVPENKYRVLGEDHGDIDTGTYEHPNGVGQRKEKMDWWTRDALDELKRKVRNHVNKLHKTKGFKVDDIKYIFTVYGGDHGKGKFRFVSKLIIDMKDGTSHQFIYQLAEIACKKDTGEVLKKTISDNIIKGINAVEDCSLRFVFDEQKNTWDVQHIDRNDAGDDPLFKEPIVYLCGDLAYLFVILGKEDYTTWWCYCCQLFRTEWQAVGHEMGEAWTLEKITEQYETNLREQRTGRDCMGVRAKPYFKVPVERVVWPVLHALIGVGGAILEYIVDYGEKYIQCCSPREVQLRLECEQLGRRVVLTKEKVQRWNEEDKSRLKELKADAAAFDLWLDTHAENDPQYQTITETYENCVMEITFLQEEIDGYMSSISRDEKKIKANITELKAYRRNRKLEENSLFTQIDNVLKEYKIQRAAHHGGDLQGNDVHKFMKGAEDIMNDVNDLMWKEAQSNTKCKLSQAEIENNCNDIKLALQHWHNLHRIASQTTAPTADDLRNLKEYIKQAMAATRKLQLSITLKMHGTEDHLYKQMKDTPGGIGRLMEYWIEKFHQDGSAMDHIHRHTRGVRELAEARVRKETAWNNDEVLKEFELMRKQHKRPAPSKGSKAKKSKSS